jgi:hypothetical protein
MTKVQVACATGVSGGFSFTSPIIGHLLLESPVSQIVYVNIFFQSAVTF